MSFFRFEYIYAINNNLTVSKPLSNVVVMIFFIYNSKKSFEIIEQKQFFMINALMILIVKFSFDRTVFAIIDFLFKMIRVVFLFLFFFVDDLKTNSKINDLFFNRYFFSDFNVRCND